MGVDISWSTLKYSLLDSSYIFNPFRLLEGKRILAPEWPLAEHVAQQGLSTADGPFQSLSSNPHQEHQK
jgi:hypothetical protein